MTIKKLESAARIIQKVKELDADIIQIDKFAMLIANEHVNCSFTLNVEDMAPKSEIVNLEPEKSSKMNYDGGLITFWTSRHTEQPKKNISSFSSEANENTALHLLGVLLMDKQNQRTTLLNQLTKYGVQL